MKIILAGGQVASGRQMVSWIYEQDYIAAADWLIATPGIHGTINLAAPNPLPMNDFMRELRRAWGMPIGLPSTRWMLDIASFFMQTETELILKSRYVLPGRLLAEGFTFQHAQWAQVADDLCTRCERRSSAALCTGAARFPRLRSGSTTNKLG